jgi:hypothetical protein
VACLPRARPAPSGPEVLSPGAPALRSPPLDAGAIDVVLLLRRPTGDTTERETAKLALSERPVSSDAARSVLTRAWSPPFTSIDTLVVDRRTLRPRDEVLSFNGAVRRYHYDGSRVTGVIVPRDSAPQPYDQEFNEQLFAFNEVDALAAALPYRDGLTYVVPLFSEVDHALEHDTLTVMNHEAGPGGATRWIVRFADPAITSRYIVDGVSRRIIDVRTTQRASGLEFHYRY